MYVLLLSSQSDVFVFTLLITIVLAFMTSRHPTPSISTTSCLLLLNPSFLAKDPTYFITRSSFLAEKLNRWLRRGLQSPAPVMGWHGLSQPRFKFHLLNSRSSSQSVAREISLTFCSTRGKPPSAWAPKSPWLSSWLLVSGSYYVAQAGFELTTLLPQPPGFRDCRSVTPCPCPQTL